MAAINVQYPLNYGAGINTLSAGCGLANGILAIRESYQGFRFVPLCQLWRRRVRKCCSRHSKNPCYLVVTLFFATVQFWHIFPLSVKCDTVIELRRCYRINSSAIQIITQ